MKCISRQRFFGVPFPLWYPTNKDGLADYSQPLSPDKSRLPIDPSTDVPDGYRADQRDRPNGFTGEADVMDTWATSSLTPQIISGWCHDDDLFSRVFPMDLRPQGHDIIRTWLFSTVLRAHLEHNGLPWFHAAVSGFVTDPDRNKMSNPKGNVVTPFAFLEEHGADGVRYGRPSGLASTRCLSRSDEGRGGSHQIAEQSKFILSKRSLSTDYRSVDRAILRTLAASLTRRRWRSRNTSTAGRSTWWSGNSGGFAMTISSSSRGGDMATRGLRRPGRPTALWSRHSPFI